MGHDTVEVEICSPDKALQHPGPCDCVASCNGAQTIISGARDGVIRAWQRRHEAQDEDEDYGMNYGSEPASVLSAGHHNRILSVDCDSSSSSSSGVRALSSGVAGDQICIWDVGSCTPSPIRS